MPPIAITVNGRSYEREVEGRLLLVDFLRDELGLTGTNIGCDTSQCGACTVHLDGKAVKSCTLLAAQADGGEVTTIEGLAETVSHHPTPALSGATPHGELHPMQAAVREHHGLQCGYCTPGMIMTAAALVAGGGPLTDDEIRHGLEGNLCRCTGYENIVRAVRSVAHGES